MPEFAILSQSNYSILRLHTLGNRFTLEEFHSEGRRALELDEAELLTLLRALPERLLREALASYGTPVIHHAPPGLSCDANPFFDVDSPVQPFSPQEAGRYGLGGPPQKPFKPLDADAERESYGIPPRHVPQQPKERK